MGYVYKITNTVNNKAYIGISIHEPTQGRIKNHLSGRGNRIIANAVKKYGKDVFTYEILEANVFDEFLPDLEVAYITNFNTVAPHGYNLDSGGGGAGSPSEDTLRKMSEARKGKKRPPFSAEHRRKLSEASKGENNPFYGKTHSAETRRKLSQANKGRKQSAEHRRKNSEAQRGRTVSTETRRKLSEAHKGRTFSAETLRKMSEASRGRKHSAEALRKMSEASKGEKHHNFGKTLSAETRCKISESLKGKYKGKNNPNFHPYHIPVRNYFFSLPPSLPLSAKRKLLYDRFPNVKKGTIRYWVRKWVS